MIVKKHYLRKHMEEIYVERIKYYALSGWKTNNMFLSHPNLRQ
jgi:hypothetical protein